MPKQFLQVKFLSDTRYYLSAYMCCPVLQRVRFETALVLGVDNEFDGDNELERRKVKQTVYIISFMNQIV